MTPAAPAPATRVRVRVVWGDGEAMWSAVGVALVKVGGGRCVCAWMGSASVQGSSGDCRLNAALRDHVTTSRRCIPVPHGTPNGPQSWASSCPLALPLAGPTHRRRRPATSAVEPDPEAHAEAHAKCDDHKGAGADPQPLLPCIAARGLAHVCCLRAQTSARQSGISQSSHPTGMQAKGRCVSKRGTASRTRVPAQAARCKAVAATCKPMPAVAAAAALAARTHGGHASIPSVDTPPTAPAPPLSRATRQHRGVP